MPLPYVTPDADAVAANSSAVRDRLAEVYEDELLFLDPPSLDLAIVGVAERINFAPVVVYDRAKLVRAFVSEGMEHEEADEWVSFNVEGAFVGERTPLILASVLTLLG